MHVLYIIECIELVAIIVLTILFINEHKRVDGSIIFGINENGIEPSLSVKTTLRDAIKQGYGRFTISATEELNDYINYREKESAQ